MRRQLITVFVAISVMVAVAFVVPLGFLVRNTAEDRAIDAARADAAAVVPVLVAGSTLEQAEAAAGATASGQAGFMTIITPAGTVGPDVEMSARLDAALGDGVSSIGSVESGVEVVTAVATGAGELSAVRVFVPDEELRRGQRTAWAALAGVAVALVALSVFVADRLATSIVRPAQELASAAHRLGEGDLSTRVTPDGPPELVELSGAFNSLGDRVSSMLDRERELVADLSHRLRTPLTKLRMRVDQVGDEALADELRADVADVILVVNDLISEARSSLSDEAETCDAAAVVSDRVKFWSVLAEDTQRPWSFSTGPAPMMVGLSSSKLAAAVDVLIQNVFAHTDDAVTFVVGFERRDGKARIWVGDAGSGITDDAAERGVSTGDSTGLGLDIARSAAEAAGGSLQIGRSSLGGSEVAVVLPLARRRGA